MGFLDDMAALLNGQPAGPAPPPIPAPGMANYGATPAIAGPTAPTPSSTATVLARIPTSGPGGRSNPLGLSPPVGGNDVAIAMSGMRAVDPHASKFGAAAQGFAGGMAARGSAAVENEKLAQQQQLTGLEAVKNVLAIKQMEMTQNAMRLAGGFGGASPSGYSPGYAGPGAQGGPSMPSPTPSSLPAAAAASGAPTQTLPPPADPPAPAPTATTSRTPPIQVSQGAADSQRLWSRVAPESNPYYLRYRAGIMDQRAMIPGLPADMANNFSRQAQQDRTSAQAIIGSGKVSLNDGTVAILPGSMEADATMAAAKAAAEKHAQNEEAFRAAPGVTSSGTKYLPNPDAPVAPGAPGYGRAATAPSAGDGAPSPAPQMPQQSSIDPETAHVSTAIPKAPAGGGYPIPPDLPPGARMTALGPAGEAVKAADKEYFEAMGNAPALDQTVEKFQSMAQAFKLFESGPRADHTQGAAMIAYGLGAPDVAHKILGGDPNALQWVEKEGAPLTLNALKSATTRFSQSEFKTYYNSAVPNPGKLPQANNQMIAEGLAQAQMQKRFNEDWQTAQQQGWQSPSAFYQAWSKANPASSFISAAQRQIGNFKGMATPSPDKWAAGVTYVYEPKGMTPQQQTIFQRDGITPGSLFRFNGRNAAQAISPVDTSAGKGFSSYLSQ